MVIPLVQPDRRADGQSQTVQKGITKGAATEAETKLIEIRLQIAFRQAVVGAQDERLGVADHDVQPMEQAGVRVVGLMLVGIALQCWNVAAIAVTANHTFFCKGRSSKFSDRSLLDVCSHPHFEIAGIAILVQRQRHENLRLFRTASPLFARYRASNIQ